LLQAALNGSRRRDEHPALPVTSWELATAAVAAVAAGAGAVHVHVRDPDGGESIAAADVSRAVMALRPAIPGIPIGVSTGAWIVPDTDLRYHLVAEWGERPDYASVNFHERGAEPLAELLLSRDVGVEAGVATAAAAERFATSALAPRCLRVLMEPQEQDLAAALHTVAAMEAVLARAGLALPCILHGVDRTAWSMIPESVARGYGIRIGFEDTLTFPDGSMAASNAVLIAEARRIGG
jgi:uncharacterized protein (DUF849 family)